MNDEIWKPLIDFPNYEVSNFGNVKSLTKIKRGSNLSPSSRKKGYLQVQICRNNTVRSMYIHRMVWQTFMGEIPNGMEINHKDGNKHNNHIDNLECVTPQQNSQHSWSLGLCIPTQGMRSGRAKLTDDLVREIRFRYENEDISQPKLAREYGVSKTLIWDVVSGNRWKHVK